MCDFNRVHLLNPTPMPTPSFRLPTCAALCLALAACGAEPAREKEKAVHGDASTGQRLVAQYQCGACHKIPETRGAGGEVGPTLEGFGKLSYIAGRIPNQPEPLVAWLMDPPALKPGTAMPAMGLTEQEARHMAAFLYTLK
jgi:cytochrome c2